MKLNSQNVRKKLNESNGFTLIELLVVIIILGILSAIVIVNVGGAKDKAVSGTCLTDATNLREALDRYYIDYSSYPPAASTYYQGSNPVGTGELQNYLATNPAPATSTATANQYLRTLPPIIGDTPGKNYYLEVDVTKSGSTVTSIGNIQGWTQNTMTSPSTPISGCLVK
jgi:type II secretion system protein G